MDDLQGPAPEMSPVRDAAIRELLLQTVRNEPLARRRRLRTRLAIWGGIGVIVAGGFATAGTVIHRPRAVDDSTVVHCLPSAQPAANGDFAGVTGAIKHDQNATARIKDATAFCVSFWESGTLSTQSSTQVPDHLAVCVAADGSAAVVPGDESVCVAIGLSPLKG